MRTYGAPEGHAYEGLALFGLYSGSSLVVAGWAYATDVLQVVLVIPWDRRSGRFGVLHDPEPQRRRWK